MKRFIACRFLIVILPIVSGCEGLWHTTSTGQSTFVSNQRLSGNPCACKLEIVVLGGPRRNQEALDVVSHCLRRMKEKPQRDRALLYADCGILATCANGTELAKRSLDDARMIIESINVGGRDEKKASSLHGSESAKLFKGEPHERVLVYLYRGLLFMRDGDYENSHACFLNASLQDALAKDRGKRGDWMTVDALLLLCKRGMSSESAEEFARVCESRYTRESSRWGGLSKKCTSSPVVVLIAVGKGPQKRTARSGRVSATLDYKEIPTRVANICVLREDSNMQLACADDLYLQAETRGRRNMDELLARKAKASEDTDKSGTVAATIGQIGSAVIPGLDLLGALIQEAAMQQSSKIHASADVRQLYSAPAKLYIAIFNREKLSGTIEFEAFDSSGALIGRRRLVVNLKSTSGRPLVIVGRIPY